MDERATLASLKNGISILQTALAVSMAGSTQGDGINSYFSPLVEILQDQLREVLTQTLFQKFDKYNPYSILLYYHNHSHGKLYVNYVSKVLAMLMV